LLKQPLLEGDAPALHSVPTEIMATRNVELRPQGISRLATRKWLIAIAVAAIGLLTISLAGKNVGDLRAKSAARNSEAVALLAGAERLHRYQEMSFTAFKAQVARRDELAAAIEKRLHITRTEEFEKFFSKYFNQLTSEERFAFDQIRALTSGHLHEANQGMLDELERNPNLVKAVPSLTKLRQHLVFWLNKYQSTFVTRADMCLLYGGVEDGVPYPREADRVVVEWLKAHSER
jgi:hypothetical protein